MKCQMSNLGVKNKQKKTVKWEEHIVQVFFCPENNLSIRKKTEWPSKCCRDNLIKSFRCTMQFKFNCKTLIPEGNYMKEYILQPRFSLLK